MIKAVWEYFNSGAGYNWINPIHIDQAMESWKFNWHDKRCTNIWNSIEWNNRAFENKERNIILLIDQVMYQAYLWARERVSMLDLSQNIVIYKRQEIFRVL